MYEYSVERHFVFTEEGQVMFLKIRNRVNDLLDVAGAVRVIEILKQGPSGDTWQQMACIDRLVELEEILEVTDGHIAFQDRVFVRGKRL